MLVLTIVGATFLSPAYACTFSSSLPSPTITQGTSSVTITGTDTCDATGSNIDANLYQGTCPISGPLVSSANTATVSGGGFTFNYPTSSLNQGSYCFYVFSVLTLTLNNSDPLTVTSAAPIPEYPLGLALLALFMVLAYSVIRRKTRT
jgi:hypothetical protein